MQVAPEVLQSNLNQLTKIFAIQKQYALIARFCFQLLSEHKHINQHPFSRNHQKKHKFSNNLRKQGSIN